MSRLSRKKNKNGKQKNIDVGEAREGGLPKIPETIEMVAHLTDRKREMAELYLRGATLDEVAIVHGITRERVRQILDRAWDKIYAALGLNDAHLSSEQFKFLIKEQREDRVKKLRRARLISRSDELRKKIKDYDNVNKFCAEFGISTDELSDAFPDLAAIIKKKDLDRRLRWHEKYSSCKICGRRDVKHYKFGYCQKCFHDFEKFGGNREKAIVAAGNACSACGRHRSEQLGSSARDFAVLFRDGNEQNISLDNLVVACWRCLPKMTGAAGSMKRRIGNRWSLEYDKCIACGSALNAHYAKGLCVKCYAKRRHDMPKK